VAAGRLDDEDIGAQVRQQAPGVLHMAVRQLDHPYALEGAHVR
jgi:hypothetical protein